MILHSQILVRDGREDYEGLRPAPLARTSLVWGDLPLSKRGSARGIGELKRPSAHNSSARFTDHKPVPQFWSE